MAMTLSDIIVLVLVGLVVWLLLSRNRKPVEGDRSALLLQNQMNEINRTIQGQHQQSAQLIKEITRELTKVGENQRQVMDVARQLEGLQNILKNPKQRGILGEYRLEVLLQNVFTPKEYQMQYKFKDGDIVDAVIFIGDKLIPIDSKFSLENYNRIVECTDDTERLRLEKVFRQDLKNRIDETAKYIRPEENTTEYAFMFIPAEGIFYDLLNNEVGAIKSSTRDLVEYAINDKKVQIVSPTTFYAALQAILQGLRDYKIQESTKEILKNVTLLGKHMRAYQEYHEKLGGSLSTVINSYNRTSRELGKIDKDVLKLTGEGLDTDVQLLEKPVLDEE